MGVDMVVVAVMVVVWAIGFVVGERGFGGGTLGI